MTTISQIAADPHKALNNLEKDLGVAPGTLLREMDQRAKEIGDDWTQHLPYTIAATYYDRPETQAQCKAHVDDCAYCQRLLESLHPTDLKIKEFAAQAARAQPGRARRLLPAYWVPTTAAASFAVAGLAAFFALPQLELAGLIHTPAHDKATLVRELRTQPTRLATFEKSPEPSERYQAARLYFAADKPQLAWQQIGEGLELAGLQPIEVRKISTAADVPSDGSAQYLVNAARRLAALDASASKQDPTLFLERAELQARLGFNTDALKSIQKYLQATNVEPKTLADFSETAFAKPLKVTALDLPK
jgi:hypothetical protein